MVETNTSQEDLNLLPEEEVSSETLLELSDGRGDDNGDEV